jgi:SPP1 gp7 family putative phage head morphogenesis protein
MAQSRPPRRPGEPRRGGSNFLGWEEVSPGHWRNPETGQQWLGWRQYGPRAGHYPEARAARSRFRTVRRAEADYARNLRQIARHVGDIVRGFAPGLSQAQQPRGILRQLQDALRGYARLIEPWAGTAAERMLAEVARRDAAAWHEQGKIIGRNLRREIESAQTGIDLRRLLDGQVELITSLPLEAAQRVQDLAVEGLTSGARWTEIAQEIMATGHVTRSRANLIARTETGHAATTLTQARAEHVGSPGYVWRAVRDADTRKRHRELDGQFILWNEPPVVTEPGQPEKRAHAGSIYNCRCWCEPVLAGETPPTGKRPRNPAFLEALRQQGYTTGAVFEE